MVRIPLESVPCKKRRWIGMSQLSPSDGVVTVVILFREYAAFGETAAGGQCRALSAKS